MHIATRSVVTAPFQLDSLEEAPAPAGQDGVWSRYVITQGSNTIVGMRSGVRNDVSIAVRDIVAGLNLRFPTRAPGPAPAEVAAVKPVKPLTSVAAAPAAPAAPAITAVTPVTPPLEAGPDHS